MPVPHASAQTLIARVSCRNRPPTRLRARNLAYIGTCQPTEGQTLGHAVQTRRWLTPFRALCLETHQTKPYPQPAPRACTHVASAPKWTYLHGKDRRPHALAVAGGLRVSTHPHLRRARKEGSVRRSALQPPPRWTAVPRLVLPRAWPAHHLGSTRATSLGVAWALCAAHTAPCAP
jgi:hypothetical protein